MDLQKSFGMELQKGENNPYGLHRLQKSSSLLRFTDSMANISGLIKQLDLLRYKFIGLPVQST